MRKLLSLLFSANALKKLVLCVLFPPYLLKRILHKLAFRLYLSLSSLINRVFPF
jgi:hypothetical protein